MNSDENTGHYRIEGCSIVGPDGDYVVLLGTRYVRAHLDADMSPSPGWADRPNVEALVDELNNLLAEVRRLEALVGERVEAVA